MKNNFFTDVASAAGVFKTMRKSRKDGVPLKVKAITPLPWYSLPSAFLNTVEGCTLFNCERPVYEAVKGAFDHLSYDVKRKLEFPPEEGEFVERARFWQGLLEPVMDPEQHQEAMISNLRWYQHIKRMRLNGGEAA